MEIECRTDADQNTAFETGVVFEHPDFLLRAAEADPNDIGAGGIDTGDALLRLVRRQGTERRAFSAGNVEPRVVLRDRNRNPGRIARWCLGGQPRGPRAYAGPAAVQQQREQHDMDHHIDEQQRAELQHGKATSRAR